MSYSDSELLSKVRQLEPVQFRYNENFDPDCVLRGGFVAQQVQEVFPELVSKVDGFLRVNTTELSGYITRALDEHKRRKYGITAG